MRAFIAAGVLLLVGTTAYFSYQTLAGHRYATPVGGLASIPLEDGSIITLNTATRVRVLFSQKKRRIKLEAGEAFFDVAKDASRPFVVESGDRRVTALGTQFSVRRDGGDLQVVVTHGKVRLESPNTLAPRPATGETGARDNGKVREKDPSRPLDFAPQATEGEVLLTAGAVAAAHSDILTVEQRSLPKAEELLSWRTGYLVFQETTLADAVAEFNRYNKHTIRIPDPEVAGIRISGKFRSTNFESFVRLLQDSPQISVQRSGDTIVLSEEAVPP